jgi:hypothetical protein
LKEKYVESKDEDVVDFPRRLEGLEKIQNDLGVFAKEMSKLIDNGFSKYGMTMIPPIVRYALVIMILAAPCAGVIMMLIFGSEDAPVQTQTKVS